MTQSKASPGRPRDDQVDSRVADAAVALFGQNGWASFSIEAVARRAGVGKASVYLRWRNKEELLIEALGVRLVRISDMDTGTVRGDLVQLVRQLLGLYAGERGQAALRLGLEARTIPGLAARYEEMAQAQILAARAIVRRGIRRGEIPEGTSVTFLLDAVCGGAMNHAMTVPPSLRPLAPDAMVEYAERFVDFVLASVLTEPEPGGSGGR
ncbi:TetR family transcriptional regulator [Streptomyces sp. MNU77]|uniref:TetR/AcrR family transcriptional regulator n=1 Tax=Streptomyces sp. MNU77 TaxID=1573406 RepID=UPI0005DFDD44|nr:TetR/AcrR family transcriptional regulator [Streptomyces sp. MNU77]OLO25732.1 TetR family transcriptional regulator [Streptomyces sp. MNU77]